MKLCTAAEMQSIDAATFSQFAISSSSIMEVAGQTVARLIRENYTNRYFENVLILAGSGNNGADAFVAARNLSAVANCEVLALSEVDNPQFNSWALLGGSTSYVCKLSDDEVIMKLNSASLLIDGLVGTGFSNAPRGELKRLLSLAHQSEIKCSVAIDIPSGICADTGQDLGSALASDLTVTFQYPKRGHFLLDGVAARGKLVVAEIGLLANADQLTTEMLSEKDISHRLSKVALRPNSHKGSKGHVGIFGSAEAKVGALKLAGLAALRAGAGKGTLFVPDSLASVLATEVTELIAGSIEGSSEAGLKSVVIGPGFGLSDSAKKLFKEVYELLSLPVVLDADAVRLFAETEELKGGESVVFTPHPGEAAAVLSCSVNEVENDRFSALNSLRRNLESWVVLKGANTLISSPEGHVWLVPVSSPVLGTAGSGDVLSGLIAGLLAQGLTMEDAVLSAVFLHARSGLLFEAEGKNSGVLAAEIAAKCSQQLNDKSLNSLVSTEDGIDHIYPSVN